MSEEQDIIIKKNVLWVKTKMPQCQGQFPPQDGSQRDLPESEGSCLRETVMEEPHRVLDEDEATAIEELIQLIPKCSTSDD